MHIVFSATLEKKARFETWHKLDKSGQRDHLEAMRTGILGDSMSKKVDSIATTKIFRAPSLHNTTSHEYQQTIAMDWDREYSTYLRIARKFEVTRSEFEFLFTISSKRRPGKRIFYPFWHASRPQADEIKWDWCDIYHLAQRMLHRMRSDCNRHGEDAGLGEKIVDEKVLVYWMVSLFCNQVQKQKKDMPYTSLDALLEANLDRWNCPIVPWVGHVFSASLCKGPDHGLAMRFGIRQGAIRATFDPLLDIDMAQSTITIDAHSTNIAMWNWESEAWPSVRAILADVPLSHSLWKIDKALGDCIWRTHTGGDQSAGSIMPTPAFDIPLLPIDHWLSRSSIAPQCHQKQCEDSEFSSISELVYHYRQVHAAVGNELYSPQCDDVATLADQEVINMEYWKNRINGKLICDWPDCGKSFLSKQDLGDHQNTHSGQKDFRCDVPGCAQAFYGKGDLARHKRNDHGTRAKPTCDFTGCGKTFARSDGLLRHQRNVHAACRKRTYLNIGSLFSETEWVPLARIWPFGRPCGRYVTQVGMRCPTYFQVSDRELVPGEISAQFNISYLRRVGTYLWLY
ncbi:hypothetical protein LMH87_005526 [Akanthomyces muscarius]|uniref:C2H2-type domain-containing protein n=1 Tax=Akanthomyces muscarius TaxID=2231603 RepID=A0A9W8UPD2_AKAMU|nr:hypothetical protein LMH87_005526 [Akanthomyces muscarius]KAJ4163822.1 hypothetical protein LMH87_005526 [Akanthomyces muscarius]